MKQKGTRTRPRLLVDTAMGQPFAYMDPCLADAQEVHMAYTSVPLAQDLHEMTVVYRLEQLSMAQLM